MLRYYRIAISSYLNICQLFSHWLLVLVCAASGSLPLRAQKILDANTSFGTLSQGRAHFSRDRGLSEDSVLHGAYSFRTSPQIVDSAEVFREIKGAYNYGRANGQWNFRRLELKTLGEPFANEFAIVQPAVGSEVSLEANFQKGIPTGKWIATERSVQEANAPPITTERSIVHLLDATPTGVFEYHSEECELSGAFDQVGNLHGVWTITFGKDAVTAIETREYKNGVLIGHTLKREDSLYVLTYELSRDESLSESTVRFFDFGAMPTAILSKRVSHVADAAEFVRRSDAAITKVLEIFGVGFASSVFELGEGMTATNPVRVAFHHYPVLKEEKVLNTQIAEVAESIIQESKVFLAGPSLQIGRLSDQTIARDLAELELLLRVCDKVLALAQELDDEALTFVDRERWFAANYTPPNWPDSFDYTFYQENQRSKFESFTPFGEIADCSILLQTLTILLSEVRNTIDDVSKRLQSAERDSFYAQKEEALIVRRDSLVAAFSDETSPQVNQYHRMVAKTVQNAMARAFEHYATSELEVKSTEIEHLERCLILTEGLHDALTKLPLRVERIDREYTKSVWNPYTYTFMEQVQKERIYKAYNQYILPHILDEISRAESCEAFAQYPDLLISLHDRLFALLDEDTVQIEKDLRRSNSATQAASILNITLPTP